MQSTNNIIGIKLDNPGISFYKKNRYRFYRYAISILNLLSFTSKRSGYPRNVKIDWTSIQRIGVFCQWGIGDAVLMTPLLRTLRNVSTAKIQLIGKPCLRELFMKTGMCDHVHICFPPWTRVKNKYLFWQTDWWKYIKKFQRLRCTPFDLLISIRYDPREILQLRLLNSRIRAAYSACGGRPWLDIAFGVNPSMARMKHVAHDSKVAAEILSEQKIDPMPLLNINAHDSRSSVKWLCEKGYHGGKVLSIFPGNRNSVRRWPDDNYTEVLKDLPLSVGFIIVIVPPEDNGLINIRWPFSTPGSYWKGPLSELQGILSVTDVLLTVDCGIMHVGAACGCRIIAIFGPQLKEWFMPYTSDSEIIIVDQMPCRPCFDKCIYDNPLCMKNIRVNVVKEAIHRTVTKNSNPRINSFL